MCEQLIHASISSKLDYCNTLLYGLPKGIIKRLQRIQNTAAHIITLRKSRDHITPILHELHWLPVSEHIEQGRQQPILPLSQEGYSGTQYHSML